MLRSGSEWSSLVQVLPLAWPQRWYLSTEIPSTQTLKACPYTGPCCQRSAESTISLEKTATLESSANMFMHAVCAVNSAAGVKYLGSNSLEFNATYVDKRFRFSSAFQHLLTFINDLFGSCDCLGLSNSPQKVLLQLFLRVSFTFSLKSCWTLWPSHLKLYGFFHPKLILAHWSQ